MITTHRKAFSMLTAIVVIVAMAVISMYVMSIAGRSIKNTTDQYRKEQAMFYAKSYTEYAIMAVSANAGRVNPGGCLQDITANIAGGTGNQLAPATGYRVRVRISYIGVAPLFANCAPVRVFSNAVGLGFPPGTPIKTQLNIIVDTYVDYRDINSNFVDPANAANNRNMNKILTYHRRSLQKI